MQFPFPSIVVVPNGNERKVIFINIIILCTHFLHLSQSDGIVCNKRYDFNEDGRNRLPNITGRRQQMNCRPKINTSDRLSQRMCYLLLPGALVQYITFWARQSK